MKKRVMNVFFALSLGFLGQGIAYAGGWTPWTNVNTVYVQSGGHVYLVLDPNFNHINPDACVTNTHFILDTNTSEVAEEIYKLVLTAKAADLRVRAYVEGCTGNFPTVQHMMLSN